MILKIFLFSKTSTKKRYCIVSETSDHVFNYFNYGSSSYEGSVFIIHNKITPKISDMFLTMDLPSKKGLFLLFYLQ